MGYTPKKSNNKLNTKIKNWMEVGGSLNENKHIDSELSSTEIKYILNNSVNSENDESIPTGSLTRVEKAYHIINELKSGSLKEGDFIPNNSQFLSFSRTPNATLSRIRNNSNPAFANSYAQPLVIYKTKGNVKHFNVTPYDSRMTSEQESWVQSNLKIKNIDHITSNDFNNPKEYASYIDDKLGYTEYMDSMGFPKEVVGHSSFPSDEVYIIEVEQIK